MKKAIDQKSEDIRTFIERNPELRGVIEKALLKAIQDKNGIITREIQDTWTGEELLTAEFPEPDWIIDGIIPVGLSVLAGRPKVGKSFLALQIAYAISAGGSVLDIPVKQGSVLYLALEDSGIRLKNRLSKQNATIEGSRRITFKTVYPTEADGFDQLQLDIMTGDYRIIIIDTISRFMGRADQMDLAEMTDISGRLQSLAQRYNTAILILDHHKKGNGFAPDVVDDLMGSTGKSAAYDTIIGLYKERGARTATLKADGRDLEKYVDLSLDWNADSCTWRLVGESGLIMENNTRAQVLEAIEAITKLGDMATTTEIANYTGIKPGNVSRTLSELLDVNKVQKLDKVGRQQPYGLAEA
jgi:archaellum biogenesis ATPase FlaH